MNKKLSLLRKTGIAEGVSLLVLVCIAMPLKYFFNLPMAVKIVGWLHGILFIAFISIAWNYWQEKKKNFKWFALAFAAAFLPTGTFFFDKKLKLEEIPLPVSE